ncbi:MAG: hypothetical protein H0U97_19660 [Gammaproteobacteria bacterium]|nr:hypothetical protein [Gammaproteobacteria bacterium]
MIRRASASADTAGPRPRAFGWAAGLRRVARAALPGLAVLLAFASPTDAAEYFVRPIISAGLDYDDNRRLDPVNPKTVTSQRYFPTLLFGVRTPAVNTSGIARAEIIEADDDELDRTNGFMRLKTTYTTPRDLWDVAVEWRQDSTLGTSILDPEEAVGQPLADESLAPDVDERPDADVRDLVRQEVQRTKVKFRPTLTHVLTPRLNLELGYRFSSTTFEDVPGTTLEDSTVHTMLGELAYQLTPIDTLIGRGKYAHFDSDASVFDQGSALGGLGHSFSETFDVELLLGATYTTFKEEASAGNPANSGDDTTFAVYLTVEKELRTGSVAAFFQRDVGGGGFGVARRGTQLDVLWDTIIVPDRWFFSLAGEAFKTDSIEEANSSDDRTYVQIVPRLRWQFSRQLALDISYRYRLNNQDRGPGTPDNAESNAGIIGLVFSFDRHAISR